MKFKRPVKRLLRTMGLRRRRPPWVVHRPEPENAHPLDEFGLFAIVPTWMEADVIAATVRNAYAQGCERVFLIDNDSPDETVAEATLAGAELAASFTTSQVDEPRKYRILNDTVQRISEADGRNFIWWLWLDADEFVHGPHGLTVRELLTGLDRRYRTVGSRYFNHFPDRKPESLPGFHPLDLQPLCEERRGNMCPQGHRKHHLQRFDKAGPRISSGIGFHQATAEVTLEEPGIATFTHHFPYRAESVTRARLEALCGRAPGGAARVGQLDREVSRNAGTISDMSKRFKTLDRVYAQDWSDVENLRRNGSRRGVRPRPWTDLVDPADALSARWYDHAELASTLARHEAAP